MSAQVRSMLLPVMTGLQDTTRLNTPVGKPSVYFYSSVIQKRTRWASQWRRVEFDNLADFGRTATVTLPVNGELITQAVLVVELPNIKATEQTIRTAAGLGPTDYGTYYPRWGWTNTIGMALWSEAQFQIDGQTIDRVDGRLGNILTEERESMNHFDSTNAEIGRTVRGYTDKVNLLGTDTDLLYSSTVNITLPFWWNRGPGSKPLPIQAMSRDKVQITVSFRPVQQCVYTDYYVGGPLPGQGLLPGVVGELPTVAGCPFYDRITGAPVTVDGVPVRMPLDWHFQDAYWLVEYISLDDREAAAFRQADLQIPFEQHIALQPQNTAGGKHVRQRLNTGGLVRDLTWVLQPQEAETYNAYFYYGRQLLTERVLGPSGPEDCLVNFQSMTPPDWNYGSGYVVPAFGGQRQDPIALARMLIRGHERFDFDSPAIMRSLIPALNYRSASYFSRYVYRYVFGFWPSGGLSDAMMMDENDVRGAANWDKLPERELVLTLNNEATRTAFWQPDTTQAAAVRTVAGFVALEGSGGLFSSPPAGLYVYLGGRRTNPTNGGAGAYVAGYVDMTQIRLLPGYQKTYLRITPGGSVSLVALYGGSTPANQKYFWIAVAGAGGAGVGGDAGNAVSIGQTGGGGVASHVAPSTSYGGGGGGRNADAGVGLSLLAGQTGISAESLFLAGVTGLQSTGGGNGGDGYYGGGGGTVGGGGGGSHVSRYVSGVDSAVRSVASDAAVPHILSPLTPDTPYAVLEPLTSVLPVNQSYNLYTWVTRYNILRVVGGRARVLFSD